MRSSLPAELFFRQLVKRYGRHQVYRDGTHDIRIFAGFLVQTTTSSTIVLTPHGGECPGFKDGSEAFNDHLSVQKRGNTCVSAYKTGYTSSPSTRKRNALGS